jgi:hypothetical protein
MLGLGAAARQPNAQAPAAGRGQMPSQGSDIFNRFVHLMLYVHVNGAKIQTQFRSFKVQTSSNTANYLMICMYF